VNHNDEVDVLARAAARARQDLNAVTSLRPVPALPSQSRRHGRARGGGWRGLLRSPAFSGVAVVVLVLGILVGIWLVDVGGSASPPPVGLLRPGAELDGMRLTTANLVDDEIFSYCDPYTPQSGIHARDCEVPQLQRLMIGYGNIAATQELLEQEWPPQRWRLFLDGQEVDLAAFGTLADRRSFDFEVGHDVWTRLWAVTVVNPTPGQHTVRYLIEPSPAGDTLDITWTITVVQ
jgi:hypothetical protein